MVGHGRARRGKARRFYMNTLKVLVVIALTIVTTATPVIAQLPTVSLEPGQFEWIVCRDGQAPQVQPANPGVAVSCPNAQPTPTLVSPLATPTPRPTIPADTPTPFNSPLATPTESGYPNQPPFTPSAHISQVVRVVFAICMVCANK